VHCVGNNIMDFIAYGRLFKLYYYTLVWDLIILTRLRRMDKIFEFMIDLQFIRNVIRGIIVIMKSYYCYQLLTKCFPTFFSVQ
jgi:hypothetical protein